MVLALRLLRRGARRGLARPCRDVPGGADGSGAGSWLASGLQLCAGPCASSRQVTAVARLPALRARAPGPPRRLGCEKRRTVLLHALTLSSLETSAVLLLVVSVSVLVSPKKPY